MKSATGIIIGMFCLTAAFAVLVPPAAAEQAEDDPAVAWNALEKSLAFGRVPKYRARDSLVRLRPLLDRCFVENGGVEYPKTRWVFPLKGYTPRSVDRYYVVHGFDFFSPVRHRDHPAYDIFIRDRNRDCLDDRTGAPVKVLSMSSGIIVGKGTGWLPGSDMRGGNYLWIYDPVTKGIFYYAHLQDIFVNVGDILVPGDELGAVGRTGKNAFKKRSPTHLHVMYLKYPRNGNPYPVRFYKDLMNSRIQKEQ